jgi:predicted CXXCH cytochrome family protein
MHIRTRYKILFGVTIVLAALYLVTDFKSVPDADATGGAFTSTKHGGADVDSEPNDGVDRSVHPDVGAFYYDDSEAGEYKPGECNHCHEPHASFGGIEPPYLLFRDNDNDLCWYCHENINFDPIFGGGVGRWRFYQGETIFTASSHGLSTSFTWPGDDGLVSPSTIWPRDRVRPNADRYKCINCHTPHGILGASGNVYDSDAVPASVQSDTAKPAIETAYLIPRQAIAWEEALCLNCHDSGGPALQGGSQFTTTNVKEQLTKTYNHPVTDTTKSGIHNLKDEDNPSTGWFSSNVHSECTDCHNPHVAGGYGSTSTTFPFGIVHQPSGTTTWNTNRGTRTQPVLVGPVNEGAWGIDVTESSGSIGSRIDALSATFGDKLYNLCLKCHSSFGMTANSVASSSASDLATDEGFAEWTSLNENRYLQDLEDNFKTSNTGYHPVFGQGKNLPSTGANSNWSGAGRRDDIKNEFTLSQTFVPPWRHTDTVTCVDCHEDEASTVGSGSPSYSTPRGPHGSSRYFILRELDCNITYDICDDAGCTTTSTIDYSTYLPTGGNASEF